MKYGGQDEANDDAKVKDPYSEAMLRSEGSL
jgi:hypothetical protein